MPYENKEFKAEIRQEMKLIKSLMLRQLEATAELKHDMVYRANHHAEQVIDSNIHKYKKRKSAYVDAHVHVCIHVCICISICLYI